MINTKIRTIWVFCIFLLIMTISVSAETKLSQITQYGITWTFQQPVVAGKFITGDWWIVGPVKVICVSPASGSIGKDNTRISLNHWNDTSLRQDTTMRNGSMIVDKPGVSQGYDSRNQLFNINDCVTFPLELKPNQTLISTESNENIPVDNFCKEWMTQGEKKVKTVLKSAAVLTCLSEIPAIDAFRPPYAGKLKPIYLSRNINWNKLPKLKSISLTPSWSEFERYFQRPWIDHFLSWQQQEVVPNENGPNYGREHARLISIASLMLMLDVPQKTKEKLTIEMIQRGIDLYGLAMAGGSWNVGGGHSSGRKWPILFASIMLNDSTISHLPETAIFQEDAQTYYGDGWNGQKVLWQMILHHGIREPYEEKQPQEWEKWDKVSESYRLCCTGSAWIGTALAARYMHAVQLWGHDAYFDYVERWMSTSESKLDDMKLRPKEESKAYDLFVTEMWKAYRKNAPEQPNSCKNFKWIWEQEIGKMVPN